MSRLAILSAEEIRKFDKPPHFSATQRQKCFFISEALAGLLPKLKSTTNKVCFILQWGYFRATGRFFLPEDYKTQDIAFICNRFNFNNNDVNIEDYSLKRKVSRAHQLLVLKAMKCSPFNKDAKALLKASIDLLADKQVLPREIIYHEASQLHQRRIEIPGYHTFVEIITQVYNATERQKLSVIESNITFEQAYEISQLLSRSNDNLHESRIQEYKTIDQSLRTRDIQDSVDKLKAIKIYFNEFSPLLKKLRLSKTTCEYFATWVQKAKISQLKQFPNKAKLQLHLLAFIEDQYYSRQDTLVDILLKSVQSIRNLALKMLIPEEQGRSKKQLAIMEKIINDHGQLEALVSKIQSLVLDIDISDNSKVQQIRNLFNEHKTSQNSHIDGQASEDADLTQLLIKSNTYYDILESLSGKLFRRIGQILHHVEFNEETSCTALMEAIHAYKENKIIHGAKNVPTQFLDTKQKSVLHNNAGKLRIPLWNAFLAINVASAIKSGALNLKHSYQYKAIQDYLIPDEIWNNKQDQLLKIAGLSKFSNVDAVLKSLQCDLEKKYEIINESIHTGMNTHIAFQKDGKFTLATPKMENSTNESSYDLFSGTGLIPIIKILKEANAFTNFTESFRHYSIKHHKLKPDEDTIIGGIMAFGHNIGITGISNMSKGINDNRLRHVIKWFFTTKNLAHANSRIIALINKLQLSKAFKYNPSTTHTSSDGQKVGVSVDSLLANYSFKYFGKDKGVSVYTFIDDSQSLFYSTVMSASEREATYVIDGLLYNDVVKSTIHSTDMHGFTESIFAATYFIEVSFAPRLKKLYKQKIYAFSSPKTYEKRGYKILPSRFINTKIIRESWNDILRFMTTIKLKESTASQLFKRLNSHSKDHPLYKAIKEFGRIIKTNFILTYIDEVNLRQRMEQQLNRVELSNKFSKAVFFANNQEFKYGTKEEKEKAIACKVLIQNAIILWNYLYLSQSLLNSADQQRNQTLLDAIKNSSMISWAHINMHGEYDFKDSKPSKPAFNIEEILNLKIAV